MDTSEYKLLFKQIAKTPSGKEQNLDEIEERLKHLRTGGALTYKDLENIADDTCWPFNKYWMWPHKDQIEKKLKRTEGWFKKLPLKEENKIFGLNDIFKNISLVSIVLRFAFPEFYAIYSCPPLKILRIERGDNEVQEYLNYLETVRILREAFGVEKAADVDEIVWAIFQKKGQAVSDFKILLSEKLPENLTPRELILLLSHSPLKIAKIFLKENEHMSAGFWAAKAFEKFLNDECSYNGISISKLNYKRKEIINALAKTPKWKRSENWGLIDDTRIIRNKIVPGVKEFSYYDTDSFINNIDRLLEISKKNEF